MKLLVLDGDGIGPEITRATVKVLQTLDTRFGLGLSFMQRDIGLKSLENEGSTFPVSVLEEARVADGILLGPISHAIYPSRAEGGVNASAELRIQLDLYANVRPSRSRASLPYWGRTPMDLVIVRENTEGFYADRNMFMGNGEFMPTPDVALAVRKVTAQNSRRVAQRAFEIAMQRRRKVTAVHKANVLKVSEQLFLQEVRAVAAQYPDVEYDEQLVDSMAAILVRDAKRFDVVVTTNMFGDILSDEAAELSGSLGLAGSINVGEQHCMAQAQHGSAPDIAGKAIANPSSLVLSAAMLLGWWGRRESNQAFTQAAQLVEDELDALIGDSRQRTTDLGGELGTFEFTDALCVRLN